MTDWPIHLVLDTSAILAYPHVAVGETIAEAADAGYGFALPTLCLADAMRRGADWLRLDLLVGHPAAVVVSSERWRAIGVGAQVLGRLDLAAARVAAAECGGYVLTGEPDAYGDDDGGLPIIAI